MRFRNKNKTWSDEDLVLLGHMMRDRVPLHTMSHVLGRSENAIRRVFKHTVFQQLLYHVPEDIMSAYGFTEDFMYNGIVSSKFYLPLEGYGETPEDPPSSLGFCGSAVATLIGFCVTGGLAFYMNTLYQNWSQLQG